MKIEFDLSELNAVAAEYKLAPKKIKSIVIKRVKQQALKMRTNIKGRMPVDTGAARDSWGAESLSATATKKGFFAGIFAFENDGMEHVQGSEHQKHNYISRLNEGHSKQAPAGFLDAEKEATEIALDNDLLIDLESVFN